VGERRSTGARSGNCGTVTLTRGHVVQNLMLVMLTVAPAAPPVEAPLPVDEVVRVHGDAFVADKPFLATVIGITTPAGRSVWGFGGIERDGERTSPDGRTLYEIASITKTMTGTLLADLVLEGRVRVDDPIESHLPDGWIMPTLADRQVSFLHLATHTSSIPRMPPGFTPFLMLTASRNDPYSKYEDENLRITLSQLELDRPIGSRYEYSNLGVGLLGRTLAFAAAEESTTGLFQKRLLAPLGLHDTCFDPTEEQLARLAPPFKSDGEAAHSWHFASLKACGGLRSTADDMLQYAEAALGRTPTSLTPAFAMAMQPWRQICEGERSIGFGWFVQPTNLPSAPDGKTRQGQLIWHNGATGGYRSFLGLMPERGCAIVVLSNSTDSVDPALTWPVMKAMARIYRPR